MSAYEELRTIYTQYKNISVQLDIERRSLPAIIAESFNIYLGCPRGFVEPITRRHQNYVHPAVAFRNPAIQGNNLLLRPYNPISDGLPTLDYDEENRFYFGICVFLEIAEELFPKEVFGILLSAKQLSQRGSYTVKIHITGREIKITATDPRSFDKLHENLLELIKNSLSGMRVEYEPKQGIGFMRFKPSTDEE